MEWQKYFKNKNIDMGRKLHSSYQFDLANFNKTIIINIWENTEGSFFALTNYKVKGPTDDTFYYSKNSESTPEHALQNAIVGFVTSLHEPFDKVEFEKAEWY